MSSRRFFLHFLAGILCLLLFSPGLGHAEEAQNSETAFELLSDVEVLSAEGLFLVDSEFRPRLRKRPARVRFIDRGKYQVTVKLAETDLNEQGFVGISAVTASGETILSPLKPWPETAEIIESGRGASCFSSRRQEQRAALSRLSPSSLKQLVYLRKKRAVLFKELREKLLAADLLNVARKREETLGLGAKKPLSAETPLAELARRLVRIEAVKQRTAQGSE